MNRNGHNNVNFFVGGEVEHTPAFSKRTLFVVGQQDVTTIEKYAREHKTPHIFMGANHSFDADPANTLWDKTITTLLDKGFWVTLDYQAHQHETVLRMLNAGIWQCRLFVPLLSVRIPKLETSSVNLTVKFDDIDFAATNPGVWCLPFHEVTDSNRFTDWQEYQSDSIIGSKSIPALLKSAGAVVAPVPVIEEKDEPTELNSTTLGLDVNVGPVVLPEAIVITTPTLAAEAYAAGATQDPLGKVSKAKGKK